MSHEYAMSRVRDALEKCGGNHMKAQRMVEGWMENDQSLIFGLIGPWMKSIVSHAVNHVGQPQKAKKKAAMPKKVSLASSEVNDFGLALVQGMRGDTAHFGETDGPKISRPGKASQAHIDAINKLVGGKSSKSGKGGGEKKGKK